MDLVIIYGAPATGKLTVAKELQKLTGYKLLHNHLTVDLLRSIFEFGEGPFFELSVRFRTDVLKAAAKHGVDGVIFTFCYVNKKDDPYMKKYLSLKKHGVRVCAVHLLCDKKELMNRVTERSRRQYKKIHTKTTLQQSLKRDYYTTYDYPNTLVIDNTDVSARKAAMMIKKHFKL